MFDTNLLFHNGATITTTGTSGTAPIAIFKTPADGIDIEIIITAFAGSSTGRTLDFIVQETNQSDGSSATDLVTFPQMTDVGRWTRRVQSKKNYLVLKRTAGTGTGLSATVTAGISSGVPIDQVA